MQTNYDVMLSAVNRLSPVCLRCLTKIDPRKRVAATRCAECWAQEMAAIDLGVKVHYKQNWTLTMNPKSERQWDRLYYKCLIANGVKVRH